MAEYQDPSTTAPAASEKRRIGARQIIALIFVILFVVFLAVNTKKTKVDFVFKDVQAPLFLVLIGAAVVGALVTLLLQFRRRHKRN